MRVGSLQNIRYEHLFAIHTRQTIFKLPTYQITMLLMMMCFLWPEILDVNYSFNWVPCYIHKSNIKIGYLMSYYIRSLLCVLQERSYHQICDFEYLDWPWLCIKVLVHVIAWTLHHILQSSDQTRLQTAFMQNPVLTL